MLTVWVRPALLPGTAMALFRPRLPTLPIPAEHMLSGQTVALLTGRRLPPPSMPQPVKQSRRRNLPRLSLLELRVGPLEAQLRKLMTLMQTLVPLVLRPNPIYLGPAVLIMLTPIGPFPSFPVDDLPVLVNVWQLKNVVMVTTVMIMTATTMPWVARPICIGLPPPGVVGAVGRAVVATGPFSLKTDAGQYYNVSEL